MTDVADLAAVVRRLRSVPTPLREFAVTDVDADRLHALPAELLDAAVDAGLPHVVAGSTRYFDALDLANVSAALRRRSIWAFGQRGWLTGLEGLRTGRRSCYSLTLAPRCPFPGHRGPCEFTYLVADTAGPQEPAETAEAALTGPGTLRVRTGTGTTSAPADVRAVLGCLAGTEYCHLPRSLHHDIGFHRRTGLANCMLAAEVVLGRAADLGVPARRSFGLVLLPPYAGLHTWVEFRVADRWTAFDPHLIRFLQRAGVLPVDFWPAHDALSGLLLRLAPDHTALVRHGGMHCEVSFRLLAARC